MSKFIGTWHVNSKQLSESLFRITAWNIARLFTFAFTVSASTHEQALDMAKARLV